MIWESTDHKILLNPRWPAEDLEVLKQTAHKVLAEHITKPSLVLASSGTTAKSHRETKLIFIAKENFLKAATAVVNHFKFDSKTHFYNTLPNFHVGGLSSNARSYLCHGRMVNTTNSKWNTKSFMQDLKDHHIHVTSLVPTQLYDLMTEGFVAPASLQTVFIGGAYLSTELEEKARALGWPLVASFGMTETSAMIAVREKMSLGELYFKPLEGVEIKIEKNFLSIKSEGLATGCAVVTAQGFSWSLVADEQGWHETQDQAEIKKDLGFKILGRANEVVKILGENVNLFFLRTKLESLLQAKGWPVYDHHLAAMPDPRRGQKLLLFHTKNIQPTLFINEFHQDLLPFEQIADLILVEEIPRNDLGKVIEHLLKSQIQLE
jgi:o-succinylbenzoate---CoA ligase